MHFCEPGDQDIGPLTFVQGLRFYLADHSVVAGGPKAFNATDDFPEAKFGFIEKGLRAWKQLLSAFFERVRVGWQHGAHCDYLSQKGGQASALQMEEEHRGIPKGADTSLARAACHLRCTEPSVRGVLPGGVVSHDR